MFQIKTALELTTAHGLPRMVTSKPLFVRLIWLLLFLFMLGLFLKGFSEFVVKLQSGQVTNKLDANSLKFQFPDIYACFENPISGSYSANVAAKSAMEINKRLSALKSKLLARLNAFNITGDSEASVAMAMSIMYPQSLPYDLLINTLAHRREQNVLTSYVAYNNEFMFPTFYEVAADPFYHPVFLSCLKWSFSSDLQTKILQTGPSAGLVANLNIDNNFTGLSSNSSDIQLAVYADKTQIPVSDWSLSLSDLSASDRRSGVRVFLTPPGEYPTDYVTSFSLGPGKHHTVEISMTQQVYKEGQFNCVSDAPEVQFVNPYDQTPYNHSYSYSYCYYYEYHRQFQNTVNLSGAGSPLPWSLRGRKYLLNFTDEPTVFQIWQNEYFIKTLSTIDSKVKAICEDRRPCSRLDYSVSISSADWPTQSSLASFVSSSVKQAWTNAKAKNLSVPAVDFLMTANVSTVGSYVRSNMLKAHFKPHRVLCDQITLSKDYTFQSFISDVGGIIGIYLGMSLLTFFELLELLYDLIAYGRGKVVASKTRRDFNTSIKVTVASKTV